MVQDVLNARERKMKVSFQIINKNCQGYYHAGVDTIDGFCFSWYRKLTEEEHDRVYDAFLVKLNEPSDRVKKDEKEEEERKESELKAARLNEEKRKADEARIEAEIRKTEKARLDALEL